MERDFVTAVDPKDPSKGNRKVFALQVYYDLDEIERLELMDSLAEQLAESTIVNSGCGMADSARDLEFWFDSPIARTQAKVRFQADGQFRFFCHAECLAQH